MAATIVAVSGLAACRGGGDTDPAADIEARPGPIGVHELAEVCNGRLALTDAHPYAGDAPHPVMVFSQGLGNADTDSFTPHPDFYAIGEDGSPIGFGPDEAQLVACATRTAQKATDISCDFIGKSDVPFFRAAYVVTVREIKTGKIVAAIPVDPGAGGCPGSATVFVGGAEVFSPVTDAQFRKAVDEQVRWDGQGAPPGSPEPDTTLTLSDPVVQGSVRLTAVAGLDPASPVIRDYLAFWAGFAAAEEDSHPDLRELVDVADPTFFSSLKTDVYLRSEQGRTLQGPLYLTVTDLIDDGSSVFVDACYDATERKTLYQSKPDGTIGMQYRIRVELVSKGDAYLAADFQDAAPGPCPPAAAAVAG